MKFDPSSARQLYLQMETDELVRIAFLEEAYVDDAKLLAKEELALRGFDEHDTQEIDRVRLETQQQRIDLEELQLRGLETEEGISSWRQTARLWVAPYRVGLTLLALGLAGLFALNSVFSWGVFEIGRRRSEGIGLLVMLVWVRFIAPTRKGLRDRRNSLDANRKGESARHVLQRTVTQILVHAAIRGSEAGKLPVTTGRKVHEALICRSSGFWATSSQSGC